MRSRSCGANSSFPRIGTCRGVRIEPAASRRDHVPDKRDVSGSMGQFQEVINSLRRFHPFDLEARGGHPSLNGVQTSRSFRVMTSGLVPVENGMGQVENSHSRFR